MFRRYFSFLAFLGFSLWVLLSFAEDIRLFVQPQQQKPSYELKVGARNSTIRNIGSFQVDSALIFPKREAKDTLDGKTKALRRKGAFFYDSVTHIVWFFDGKHFRRADSSIYNSDGVIEKVRQVDIRGKDKAYLYFKNGSVWIDTLLLKNKKLGRSSDSLLVVRNDSVYRIGRDSVFNIYNKDDSIKEKRTVTLSDKGGQVGKSLHFTKGSVHIDTLLLRNRTKGMSSDSLLVVRNDSVYRIGRDSVFNIYNKSDSIKSNRTVTLAANGSDGKSLSFTKGSVHIDTLLIRKSRISGKSRDSFLVRYKDTVKYLPFDSLRTIYNKDDSIKSNRVVTLAANGSDGKSLHFTKGSVHIDTLLLKNKKLGTSFDSLLVVRKDSVYRIGRDSVFNIYNKSDSIRNAREVVLHVTNGNKKIYNRLYFKDGSVHVDTLLIKKLKQGSSSDSVLVVKNDSIRRISVDSLKNIYTKSDSIIADREVVLHKKPKGAAKYYHLHFKEGAVWIDTLLLKNKKLGTSFDSLLVVRNDSVYRIGRDSVFNIYNKSDSIKSNRVVTLAAKGSEGKSLHFTKGSVHIDTLLIKKSNIPGNSRDSFLVRYKDTVKYLPFDSLRTIYNKDDSIKEKRTVTLSDKSGKVGKSLHFTKGSVHIDTLLIRNRTKGTSFDSVLVVKNDSVYRIGRDSVFNIYNKSDSIRSQREVVLHVTNGSQKTYNRLYFKEGSVHVDTLLIRKLQDGSSKDSILVVKHDSVRRISVDSLKNIYTKSDSIISNREVVLHKKPNGVENYYHLHFKGGSVWIDTLLLKNKNLGTSFDSLLVVRKDSVYRIGRDSVFNIYNKSDSIKSNRVVTLAASGSEGKSLHFTKGSVHIDTLLIRKSNISGNSRDSFLVRYKDTVKYLPFDSLRTIYNKDDSIKSNRVVTLADNSSDGKSLSFTKGSVHIDTLLLRNRTKGMSSDSLLVVRNDSVYRIGRDSVFNIYNKSDSIRSARDVVLHVTNGSNKTYNHLYFKEGSVWIDTLLLRNRTKGMSSDSLLVVRNDSVYRIGRDSVFNIYNKSDSIKSNRTVTLAAKGSDGKFLHFTKGSVHIDTLLLRKSRISGKSRDSFLVRYKDTVKYLPFDSLRTIYNKDDSIKEKRTVTLSNKEGQVGQSLHFTKGSVHIDTLLLKNGKKGTSFDSLLVVRKDSVYRISRDSVFNIYNKSDSIKSNRVVTLADNGSEGKSLSFTKGSVHIDTLLLRNRTKGMSSDSLLVVRNDSVYRIGRDSVFNIYNKSDSIKSNRTVTLADNGSEGKSLSFTKGSVHIDTLLIRKLKDGSSKDSILVVKNDSVRRISVDSLKNIYIKDDSIISNRTVVLNKKPNGKQEYYHLHFKGGSVWIDTLLLKNRKEGMSSDSVLVVRNDSVYRIGRDSVFNIYNKSDSIKSNRVVTLAASGSEGKFLHFTKGSVHIDTLLIRKLKDGSSKDSILVVKHDSIRRISVDSLKNIYTKDDSIISNREVVLNKKPNGKQEYYHLHFKGGAVWIDTLLLRNRTKGMSSDSVLVVRNDSVYRIGRDSVFNIYNKDDSIKSNRVVTLSAKDAPGKFLHFTKGSVHIDTLLLKKSNISGNSRDSFLVRYKDTVKYLPFDSLRTIYNKDDSIKSKRTVTLSDKGDKVGQSLHFIKGSVHIDTLLIRKLKDGSSKDSILVVKHDSIRRISVDSLKNIYTKSDSIIADREVVLHKKPNGVENYYHLHFKGGAVWIDTLLLRNGKKGTSFDSVLVVKNDSVYRIGRDSVFNIYNKNDSIREDRVVTIKARNGSNKVASLKFKDGRVEFDTIFLRGNHQVTDWDSVLVVKNDTVRKMYLGNKVNIKNIYTDDDSIKSKRTVTLSDKDNKVGQSLHFTKGAVWIDTLLLKNRKVGRSSDSLLVVRKDSVYRIGRDSVFNIYNKSDSIRSQRDVVLHVTKGDKKTYNRIYFKEGSVHIDTLLIRKLKDGSSKDSILVVKNDSVRRISFDSLKNIYTKNDSIISNREVVLHKKTNGVGAENYYHLHFKGGAVWIDTLLLKNRKEGRISDSLLVVRNDSVYRIGRDSVFNIYNKSDSIRSQRDVVLHVTKGDKKTYNRIYFKEGSVHIDTLLLKNRKKGTSFDSLLVVRNDSVYRIGRDSVFNIYNKSDSIKSNRVVTLADNSSEGKSLHFTKGSVHIDTLLLKKSNISGNSRDSFLVRYKDTVKYLPFDSLRTIYNKDDSIKEKRTVTLSDKSGKVGKSLHFTKGSVHVDTLLIRKLQDGSSKDSILVVKHDSVRRISVDSLKNIYTKDDSIISNRTVVLNKKPNGKQEYYHLHFKGGSVWIDTLLLRNRKKGTSFDSLLVVRNDSVYRIGRDSVFNIYNKSDSIREDRVVTIKARNGSNKLASLKFKDGRVEFDTIFLRGNHQVTDWDSVLVVKNDTVRKMYLGNKVNIKNIYTNDDSIKSKRIVTLSDKNNKVGQSLHFIKGSVHIDTLLLKNRKVGRSSDSLLVVRNDSVYRIGRDSVFNIYNKSDSIREDRVVTIKAGNNKPNVTPSLKFRDGRVEVDTLLVRKRRLGLSTDTLLVVNKDTVRYIPKDSLWNIYTGDDSLRKTGTDGKRTVYLNAKKLIFELGNNTNGGTNNNGADSGKIGIGQKNPVYTLDIATNTALREPTTSGTTTTTNNDYDSVAVRISHNVTENGSGDESAKARTRYGLLISEHSYKAFGRSAIGFYSDHSSANFVKARLWTQVGSGATAPKFGIDVANGNRQIQTRLIIDSAGRVGIDTLNTGNSKLRIAGKGVSFSDGIVNISNPNYDNYLHIQAGGTVSNYSGIWLTEHNNNFGWRMVNDAKSDEFQLVTTRTTNTTNTSSDNPFKDTVLAIKRNGATVLNAFDVGFNRNPSDSIALLIKHNVWEPDYAYTFATPGYTYGLMLFDSSNKAYGRSAIGFLDGGNNVGTLTASSSSSNNGSFPAFVKARMWTQLGEHAKHPKFGIDVADSNRRIQNRLVINHLGYVGIGEEHPTHLLDVKNGRTAVDTLLIRKLSQGSSKDSVLVVKNDSVRRISVDSLKNIYTKDDSIKSDRTVTLAAKNAPGKFLHFTKGSVHIDTLLLKNRKVGRSFDSLLVVRNDSVYRIGRDSVFNIYNKSDSIREDRIVTIKAGNNKPNVTPSLKFKDGRVEVDTLLVRKRRLGLSTDTLLVVHKDTVRYIPKDSLWNIYTGDDSLRKTAGTNGKRTVYLNAKKLVFALGNTTTTTNGVDSGKIGIGQKDPVYTLDISTNTALGEPTTSRTTTTTATNNSDDYDSVAVRITHNVIEASGGQFDDEAFKRRTRYGLLINEHSNKAFGRSALGFYSGHSSTNFVKARLWSQLGIRAKAPKFGIDVADSNRQIQTRFIIDSAGGVGIDTLNTGNSKLRIAGKGVSFGDGIVNISNQNYDNYLRLQAGGTASNYSGIWLTEHNNIYGWKMVNDAKSDKFQLVKTDNNSYVAPTKDTILDIKRTGVTVLNVDVGSAAPSNTTNGNPDSIALLIKHNVWEPSGQGAFASKIPGYTYGLMFFDSSNKAYGRSAIGFLNGGHNVGIVDPIANLAASTAALIGNGGATATATATTTAPTSAGSFPAFVKARMWTELGELAIHPKFGIDVADGNRQIQTRMVINHLGYVGIGEEQPAHLLDVKNGRTALDTLLIRKKISGTSTDSLLVMFKDTVRYITKDSLWNIYTGDDSLRKTGTTGKRTVYLNAKKLVFALGNTTTTTANNNLDIGKVGIGQMDPNYTLDIATASYIKNGNSNPANNNGDTIAMRISHNVTEGSGGNSTDELIKARNSYGLVITENSNKAYGRSAFGFQNGGRGTNSDRAYMKGALWTQLGSGATAPKFGIDVADNNKTLQTRMVIDNLGRVGIGIQNPTERLHIRRQKSTLTTPDQNFIRVEAPGTGSTIANPTTNNQSNSVSDIAGLWLTEHGNSYGWTVLFDAANSGEVVSSSANSTNYVGSGDFFSIDRTRGNVNEYSNTSVTKIPVIRIPGNSNNSSQGVSRNDIAPVVVIAPKESTSNAAVQFRVHGKIQSVAHIDYSDSILKKDVHNIDQVYGRNIINSLRPVTYHMRSDLELQGKQDTTSRDSSSKQLLNYGFIAQDVERVMPDIVEKSKFRLFHDQPKFFPDSIKSMNYSAIIAPLVANVQLLNKDLEKAERKLATSEQENAALRSQVEKLQSQVEELQELFRRYIESSQGKGRQPSTKLEK